MSLVTFINTYILKLSIFHNFLFRLGTLEKMLKVCVLFQDHPDLIEGFNAFLPDGYKIEVWGFGKKNKKTFCIKSFIIIKNTIALYTLLEKKQQTNLNELKN